MHTPCKAPNHSIRASGVKIRFTIFQTDRNASPDQSESDWVAFCLAIRTQNPLVRRIQSVLCSFVSSFVCLSVIFWFVSFIFTL